MRLCEKVWMTRSGANRNPGFAFRFGQKLAMLPNQTHQISFGLEKTATAVLFFSKLGNAEASC